jgi:hypothetical protein
MLKQAIQSAIEHRQSITIYSNGEVFVGTPIDVDVNWLRLICCQTDTLQTGHWIIQLDSISSVGIAQCNWGEREDLPSEQINADDDEPGAGVLT